MGSGQTHNHATAELRRRRLQLHAESPRSRRVKAIAKECKVSFVKDLFSRFPKRKKTETLGRDGKKDRKKTSNREGREDRTEQVFLHPQVPGAVLPRSAPASRQLELAAELCIGQLVPTRHVGHRLTLCHATPRRERARTDLRSRRPATVGVPHHAGAATARRPL